MKGLWDKSDQLVLFPPPPLLLHSTWNQISVFGVYHLPQFFSWFIFLLALTKAAVPFWRTIFLTLRWWWRWGRWRSISIHDRPNLQIFRNPERKLNTLWHTHTQTHTMFLFPQTSGKRVIEKEQCRLWSRRGSGPSQDATWCKKQEVTLTNASAEWQVSLCLLATLFWGFAQFACFSVSVSLGEFGAVHSSERPLSTFTVTRGKNPSVVHWAFVLNEQRRNLPASKVNTYAQIGCD